MREKVRNTLLQFQMLPKGARLVVGFSGGADSVALLHVLSCLQEEFAWQIIAVHVHHGLRGAAADGDARFAEDFCARLGLPCIVKHCDVRAEAKNAVSERRKRGGFCAMRYFGRRQERRAILPLRIIKGIRRKRC